MEHLFVQTLIGDWPPVATYPSDLLEIALGPKVCVELTFANSTGTTAIVRRALDGKKLTHSVDPQLSIPPILLEAGLLMPSRLPKLRFDEGRGKLTDAVQKLTGLDELIELGAFIQGLCHGGRDYLSYKKAELAMAEAEFAKQVEATKVALAAVNIAVPDLKIADTDDANGTMAKFGKEQNDRAGALIKVVSDDLAQGLDLTNAQLRSKFHFLCREPKVISNPDWPRLQKWKIFESISNAGLPAEVRQRLAQAISNAKASLATAIEFHNKAQSDTRYKLKPRRHNGMPSIAAE